VSTICRIGDFEGATVAPDVLRRIAAAAGHRRTRDMRYWREDPVEITNLVLNAQTFSRVVSMVA
jgi:hypothetical protein